MSNILGISAGYHDAGVSVVSDNGEILFASHSERFSKIKHDKNVCTEILSEARNYGDIETVAWYENVWLKQLRQIRSGEKSIDMFNFSIKKAISKLFYGHSDLLNNKIVQFKHHKSHAAAGFQTSPYANATVVVIDAIGEFQTASIWSAFYNRAGVAEYKCKWSMRYPTSIGLFYSAFTKAVGLRPMDEEYILMGMAAYGNARNVEQTITNDVIQSYNPLEFKQNLHIGLDYKYSATDFDIAAAAQAMVEKMIMGVIKRASRIDRLGNLVYMGGVALNCSANRLLGTEFDNIWIMPNPGDAGSSLGAAALAYGKKLKFKDAFLGHNIEGEYPVEKLIAMLQTRKIVGVANGRAEFGPRALGNRSLLADPRGNEIKDLVNTIKHRQKFRPFAPVILEEQAHLYFNMPWGFEKSPYMQVTAMCREPENFPAIVHADGTSRVQTVPDDDSGIRKLLRRWYNLTGCPMLLNTSLNIRGEPIVNDMADAERFEREYGVKVFTKA